jgi:hypothetical protein
MNVRQAKMSQGWSVAHDRFEDLVGQFEAAKLQFLHAKNAIVAWDHGRVVTADVVSWMCKNSCFTRFRQRDVAVLVQKNPEDGDH